MDSGMEHSIDFRQRRDLVYQWLWHCLIGPGQRVDSELAGFDLRGIAPLDRYQSAILFPLVKGEDGIDPAGEAPSGAELIDDDDPYGNEASTSNSNEGDPVSQPRRRYTPPSSAGFFDRCRSRRLM